MTSLGTKPPYRVPTMDEIRAIQPNGLTVASTFSGAGGSCTGYRMAGYRVVWANEFVPAAQASYKANADPSCILDPRDVRTVTADDILAATGLARGEIDLFDGSPPCQAFSMAGKRAKGWGKERHYEHGAHQKNEDLFFEYIRLLDGLQPRTFVAENVSGLVKGVAKGYFLDILKGLKACGYRVTCRVLDAQWLGVPQCRQRAIFVGVRDDLGIDPVHPKPLPYRYSVRDALPELGASSVMNDTAGQWAKNDVVTDKPCQAITNGVNGLNSCHFKVEQEQAGARGSGPIDVTSTPSANRRAGRAGALFVASADGRGAHGKAGDITGSPAPAILSGTVGNLWIEGANGYNNYAPQSIEGPAATVPPGRSLSVMQLPPSRQGPGAYGVQGVRPEHPCPTVTTASHGNDLAVPHGTTRRKFTIAELKRICAFPDDYILTGSYAQQWERLGNSVPPVMMYHIAAAIRDRVLLP